MQRGPESSAMIGLEKLFTGWRQGDSDAFRQICNDLWTDLFSTMSRYVRYLGAPSDIGMQVVSEAFWLAMEELDIMISDGKFLIDSSQERLTGRVSERVYEARDSLHWQSDEEFLSFVRQRWVWRIQERLRRWTASEGVSLDAPGAQQLDTSMASIVGIEDHLSDQLLAKSGVEEWLKQLEALCNDSKGSPGCQELIRDTMLYVRWLIASCNPRWLPDKKDKASDEPDVDVNSADFLQRVADASLDDLFDGAELRHLDGNGHSWREFLLAQIAKRQPEQGSNDPDRPSRLRNTLDMRISRCSQRFGDVPIPGGTGRKKRNERKSNL